jgi:hypothetical protein
MSPAAHILLVEDDPQIRRFVRLALECVFQPIVDGISGGSWTGFQRDCGRRFRLIMDAVSA